MKSTGAQLAVKALEDLGIRFTFGIPGVHNTELYDELNASSAICPVLVSHEMGAAFMADGLSRTSDSIGTLVIVPAAGATHAMSGIGEAYLAGIPMLIISGGIRIDTGKHYQLHDVDQLALMEPLTRAAFRIRAQNEVRKTIFLAHQIAHSGQPGPVFVEIPVNVQLFRGPAAPESVASEFRIKPAYLPLYNSFKDDLLQKHSSNTDQPVDINKRRGLVEQAADLLLAASHPGLFVGWGARSAAAELLDLSEKLGIPVATTLQGKSVFPADHPMHCGMGAGNYSVPAAQAAFHDCDCLLAVGLRFAEIPTGSFGMSVPENLIHVDIEPEVFNKNYPAAVAIEGDATEILQLLTQEIKSRQLEERLHASRRSNLQSLIQNHKEQYLQSWLNEEMRRVNPAILFQSLRKSINPTDIVVLDDGNHTFLAAELFDVYQPGTFISPTDFNSMGYAIPASIGAAFANPNKLVTAIVGDGAFLMTGLEAITAVSYEVGLLILVFHDGELSQISQGQSIPYNRKTCTVLGDYDVSSIARGIGASTLAIRSNTEVASVILEATRRARDGEVMIVDVEIDYSRKTQFTKGIVETNLSRFALTEKVRFIGRAIKRKITG
ncbi:MAG: thiamine pyrophosphate-binding protein [Leptospiraceae bacterium]